MFLGHHRTRLKSSNRLPLPSTWRELVSNGAYITQGFDKNLLILMPDSFQEIYDQIASLNIADPMARLLGRMFLGTASYIEGAEHETIALPPGLLGYASLESNIVVVGQGGYVEVWSSDLWQEQQVEIENAEANAQRFATFTISTVERT